MKWLLGLLGLGVGFVFSVLQMGYTPQDSLRIPKKLPSMVVSSPAFGNNEAIPDRFTCMEKNVSPPMVISWVPKEAKSLVFIIDDPDAPFGVFTHWLLWNIPPETKYIEEGKMPEGAVSGYNGFGRSGYSGPCPVSGLHRYFFTVTALDSIVGLNGQAKRSELEDAMRGHTISEAHFYGRYNAKLIE